MKEKKHKITDAEMYIMRVLWQADHPLTSNAILEQTKKNWKITTLITLAGKLIDKGFIKSEKVGRSHAHQYTAIVSEEEYKRAQTNSFLDTIHKGSVKSLINTLFQDEQSLSESEVNEIKELINKWSKNE